MKVVVCDKCNIAYPALNVTINGCQLGVVCGVGSIILICHLNQNWVKFITSNSMLILTCISWRIFTLAIEMLL